MACKECKYPFSEAMYDTDAEVPHETRHEAVLKSFVGYCEAHPNERFWQALRNWSGFPFIFVARSKGCTTEQYENADLYDTFYWEGRDK